MSKGVKKLTGSKAGIGGLLGGVGGALLGAAVDSTKVKNPLVADKSYFDISEEAKAAQSQYAPLLAQSQANQQATAPGQAQVLAQMALAAQGKGPSLAEMQLRQAQDRGLQQQLAAAQAQRAQSPALAQRQLLLNMGNANRDLAQQSAIERLKERDAFLQQANMAQQNLRTDIGGTFNYAKAPKEALQNWEMARVGGINAARQQEQQNKNALLGSILGGASQVVGGLLTGGASTAAGAASKAASGYKPQFAPTFSDSQYASAYGAPGFKEGGLVSKKDANCYKDGGFISAFQSKLESLRRSGNAGSGAKATQDANDQTKAQESAEAKRKRYEEQQRAIRNLAEGGPVDGPGTSRSDSIPAMLSDGEFVVKASSVAKPGMLELLQKINAGKISAKAASKEAASYGHVLKARRKKAD